MPRIAYVAKDFRATTMEIIRQADTICREYATQGFDLTLRQLYYQFVARGLIANKQTEYDRLGAIVNDARLAGLLDWNYIVDRTRNLRGVSTWESPASIIESAAYSYRTDKWRNQNVRPEVWIEKDALVGVFERICTELEVDYFSCRGYTSQSELWSAARRHTAYERTGKQVVLFHFGDHDPSGIDMTRDVAERLALYSRMPNIEVVRLALNWDQIQLWQPPENPAKETDARFNSYVEQYGESSWELDAVEPAQLARLVTEAVTERRDERLWQEAVERETAMRDELARFAEGYE